MKELLRHSNNYALKGYAIFSKINKIKTILLLGTVLLIGIVYLYNQSTIFREGLDCLNTQSIYDNCINENNGYKEKM